MTTINNRKVRNKGFTEGKAQNLIIKKLHRISDKTFVVIDETLVKRLALDEVDDAWFEQELTSSGILLKIYRNSSGDLKRDEIAEEVGK
jgi:hypothetical protein